MARDINDKLKKEMELIEINKEGEARIKEVVVPVWPYIVMGLLFTIMYAALMLSIDPALSEEEISEQVDKVEEISYSSYNDVKLNYGLISREDVEIKYSADGSVERVIDEKYFQDFKVNKDSNLTEKESNEELNNLYDAFEFVNYNRNWRARRNISYTVSIVPIMTFMFAFILDGINKKNIKKLKSIYPSEG